jgi:hypothetical protein
VLKFGSAFALSMPHEGGHSRPLALLPISGGELEIAGWTDFIRRQESTERVPRAPTRPRLLLTHYPGWADDLDKARYDLMVAGHMHGGQIHFPFVTCALVRHACEMTRRKLKEIEGRALFVASGPGFSELSLRLFAPPRFDMLTIRFDTCKSPLTGAPDQV